MFREFDVGNFLKVIVKHKKKKWTLSLKFSKILKNPLMMLLYFCQRYITVNYWSFNSSLGKGVTQFFGAAKIV